MIYTVTFNPALDYNVYAENLHLGATNRSYKEELVFGGKGINVSFVLKELGVESVALGFIAGFTGRELERQLQEANLKTDLISLKQGATRINIKLKGEEETEINAQGSTIDAEALKQLLNRLSTLKANDTLVLAGSIPPSLPADLYEQIAKSLQGKGIRLVVDAAGELLKRVIPYRPFLIKPNLQELEELAGHPLPTEADRINAAKELQKAGAESVLVSMGAEGALLIDQSGCIKEKSSAGTVINSVGAGDSMIAGFLAGLEQGKAIALKWGIAAGCATAFSNGLAKKEEIYALFHNMV